MTNPHRRNRCDTVLALIDECLAQYERSTPANRLNRPVNRPRNHQEMVQ